MVTIPANTIYFWLVLTNIFALAVLGWSARRLPRSPAKRAFVLFIPGYLCWSNPLLLVQLQSLDSPLIRFTSQCIYGGGILFVASLGHFVIALSAPQEIRSWRFWLFMANYLFLLIGSFAGYLESGMTMTAAGLQPLEGPLFRYFNSSMLAFGLYFLTVCGLSFVYTKQELLAVQLRTIFWTAVPSFALLMITNSIFPAWFDYYAAAPAGALWLLLFFSGISYILTAGKTLLPRDSFS